LYTELSVGNSGYNRVELSRFIAAMGITTAILKVTGYLVPIPTAVWLLGSGLVGLVGFRRKFRKAKPSHIR